MSNLSINLGVIRQRPTDVEIKKYAISLLKEAGSIEYTRQYLIQKETDARDEIKRLGGNQILEQMLTQLAVEYTPI